MNLETADPFSFAYVVPLERFVYTLGGLWELNYALTAEGIKKHLHAAGMPADAANDIIRNNEFTMVYGVDMVPGKPRIFDKGGHLYINTWVRPSLEPAEGPYPRIERILKWLCSNDEEGGRWLKHWLALKMQNPHLIPKVAVVFGTSPGAGKNTLAEIIRAILGHENTAAIQRGDLEGKFNAHWAGKLFVFADEVVSNENTKDISNKLKVLIDSPEIPLEGKYRQAVMVPNRAAWVFASNDIVSPVILESNDRRYSVFTNHNVVPPEHKAMLVGLFSPHDRRTFTDSFRAEVAGFAWDLLHMEVDREFVYRPYANESRSILIEANKGTHEMFFDYVNEHGIDELVEHVLNATPDFSLNAKRAEWDFDEEGVATSMVYACYVEFSRRVGGRPLKANKFGAAVKNTAHWTRCRRWARDKQVWTYVVPRSKTSEEAHA